ncbi:MAG: VWA domain-containing protein [Bacteroidetes bacterium]|nr:VWA domain-containing protein [Bacteroidota bacterium]
MVQSFCQEQNEPKRVLFVLDASGSMVSTWGNATKMEIAKQTLLLLVDSIEKSESNIELGLRVFGHQSNKALNDCKDSKLEVDFAANNSKEFRTALSKIVPKGNTPIAFSLIESANDFDLDERINSIILITDGLENCEGNPCDAAKYLNEKRISINPFIIGLDIEDSLIHYFDCIGSFVNAKNSTELNMVLQNTISKATGTTSLSIILESSNKQNISNTPISIIDPNSQEILYTYIHSLTKKGLPDTLFLDPRGQYQVKVHSYPSLLSQRFQLKPSEHNTLIVSMPKSYLDIDHKKQYDENEASFLVRNGEQWVYNYKLNDLPILAGTYQLVTSLRPTENLKIEMKADKLNLLELKANGKLSIENKMKLRAAVYLRKEGIWSLVYDLGLIHGNFDLKLQAGSYSLIYIFDEESDSEQTHRYDFEINAERTSVIQLK